MTILELDVYISIDRGPYFQLLQIWQCGKNVAQKPKEFFFFVKRNKVNEEKNHAQLALPTKINLNFFPAALLMAIHMQDNKYYNVEKYSSETINIWPSTSAYTLRVYKQKKKGKKVLGLEKFPSIIEVLNPNDLFDEKSKIFTKLFSHKSSLFQRKFTLAEEGNI